MRKAIIKALEEIICVLCNHTDISVEEAKKLFDLVDKAEKEMKRGEEK